MSLRQFMMVVSETQKGSNCMISLSSLLCAISLTIPELPQVISPEVEVVTNISLAAWSEDTRIVALNMAFNASSSNNVFVVFGRDIDSNGNLERDEEALCLEWDCGEFRVLNSFYGDEVTESVEIGSLSLSWILRLFPDLTVKGFEARVNGEVCFDALRESMLPILFDKNWNMVKVGCRGGKVDSPQIFLSAHTIPFRLIVR